MNHYLYNLLVAIDQLGNALAGGNPDSTVSARVGHISTISTPFQGYWLSLEAVIDWAFYPIDGDNHCYNAYINDMDNLHHQGNDVTRAVLGLLILMTCPVIGLLTRGVVLIFPHLHFNKKGTQKMRNRKQFNLRLSAVLREALIIEARHQHRSLNNLIEYWIKNKMECTPETPPLAELNAEEKLTAVTALRIAPPLMTFLKHAAQATQVPMNTLLLSWIKEQMS